MEEVNNAAAALSICHKCGGSFSNLEKHLKKSKKKSCIGIWYVCRRCGHFFEFESQIERHQSNKHLCSFFVTTPLQSDMPREMAASIRYMKAISESRDNYLKRAIRRGLTDELTTIMEACSLDDLLFIFDLLSDLAATNSTALFKILAIISDFANKDTTNLEKRMLIREFVDKHISL